MFVTLGDGTEVRAEEIERAGYYPKDAFSQLGCHFAGLKVRECPFLAVKLPETVVRIQVIGRILTL
jgi:hypothetical protein